MNLCIKAEYTVFTASPYLGEKEHDLKGRSEGEVAIHPRSDERWGTSQ